jgi:hypothetical protein
LAGVLGAACLLGAGAQAGITDRLAELLRQQMEAQQRQQKDQQQQQRPPAPSTDTSRGDECGQLVDREAANLDASLRTLAGNPRDGATKVVPVLVGTKSIGAAQVYGGVQAVQSVQGVVSCEVSLSGKKLQGRMLLPVSSRDLSRGYQRVPGVAVLTVLDYKTPGR